MRGKRVKTILGLGLTLFLVIMLSIGFYSAQVMADPGLASDLAAAIGVDPADLISATFSVDEVAGAVVSGSIGFLSPTQGSTFAMISSGNAQPLAFDSGWVGTPTDFLSVNNNNPSGTGPLGESANDIATLSLTLSVPAWANSLSFNFRFMSEEYPDFLNSTFNDFFSCLLDGTNIAFDGNDNIINVNNDFFDPGISTAGTVFNATTVLLTSQAPVTGDTTVELDFVVGDVGDSVYDSAVFLDNFHFSPEVIGGPSTEPTEYYSLTVNVVGSGAVDRNATGPYVYGDVVELTAVPDAGWTFSGWSGDLSGSANPTSIVMDANKSVTATFTQDLYSLTVDVVGSGSVNFDVAGPYVYGDVVELTAVPDVGWVFSGWSGDLSGSANPESIVMDGNKSVTATFTQETYSLTVNVIGSGNVGRNVAGPYVYGDVVQLTAVPAAGWKFSSWSGGLSGSTNPTTIVMNGDKIVTATFTQETFSLTVNVIGSGSVNRNAAGPYENGEVVELTAVPDAGWAFSGWSGGLSGSTNPTTIVMNADKSVTATFQIVNDPPYQPQLSITSLTVENSNDLTVTVTGPAPADPDGDTVTYTYRWLVDTGTGEFQDDELAGRGNHTGNVVPAADTVIGDTWRVEVTPQDEHGAVGSYAVATWQVVSDATKPVADAGSDQTVNEEALVTFSGSESWDNLEIVSYVWTFTDVTPRTLTGMNPAYSFTELGVYAVTLNVTDAQGNWDTDTILITVKDVTSPIAKAGIDQIVLTDNAVNFNAGGSSDNVGINKYEWDFGDGNTGTGLTATHTYNETGNYLVTLTVEDEAGNRATASCMITVEPSEVAGEEVTREPRSLSSVAQVAMVGTAAVAASAAAASSGAVGQALNSAVSGLPIPDWLKEFLQLYGKDAFETVDKTEMTAMEKAPLISKGELAAISISAVTMTAVFSFVEANGLPDVLNVSVLAVVIPSVLLAVLMENVAEVFAEALSARICRVYRKVTLWLYGTGLFIVSGLLFRLPSGAPTITRYQGGAISDKTKCLIILSKLLILLTLALPFAGLYMLGFEILGDAGLLMTLMSVFYYFIPLKPIVGKAVFDYQKVVSLLALVATGILFFTFALNLLPHTVYLAAGVVSLVLAAISLVLLSKSSSEITKPTANT